MKGKLFVTLCGIWVLGAADAIEIVSPTEGETVRQHFPAQVEYLTRPLVERECYFDGKENAQALRRDGFRPRPAEIRWKDAAGPVRVTVKRLPDGKVFFAETVVGTNAVAVDSLEIARAWELTVADGQASASVNFRTEDLAPRLIRIENVPNARDLGGWKGLDGRRIRQGVLFRTSGLNDNPPRRYLPGAEVMRLDAAGKLVTMDKDGRLLHQRILRGEDFASVASVRVGFLPEKARARLTDAERTRALKAYGFQIDVDLRRDAECFGMSGSPLGGEVRWHHVPYLPYDIDGEAARDCNRRVLRFLLDPANHPAVFHCIGGADRTGTVACLIEALLGVGEDDLWKDYLATGFWGEVSNRKHHDMFAHLLYQLRQRGGHSLAECARSYFLDLGFTAAEITAFRELMLEHLEKPNFGGTKHADWRTMLPRPIYDERPADGLLNRLAVLETFRFKKHRHYDWSDERRTVLSGFLQKRAPEIRCFGRKADEKSEQSINIESASSNENVGVKTASGSGLNASEQRVVRLILRNSSTTEAEIANQLGVTLRQVERIVAALKKKAGLNRRGSDKTGEWYFDV